MKIIKSFILLIFFSSFIVNANNGQDDFLCKDFEEMVDLNLPFYASEYDAENLIEEVGYYDVRRDNNQYSVKIIVTFDNTNENLVKISISRNYFQITEISQGELEEAIVSNFSGDGEQDENDGMSPHASCIESCKDKYTDEDGNKIPGRGACKANCWVDTGIRTLDALSPF